MASIEFAIERRARKKTAEYICLRSLIRNSNETRRLEREMDRCAAYRDLSNFDQVNELLHDLRSRLRIEKKNMRRLKRAFVANKLTYDRYVSNCEELGQTVDARKVEELLLHGSRQETEDLLNYIDANDQASDHLVFIGMTLRRELHHVDLHLEHERLEAKFRQLAERKAELEAKPPLSEIVDATTSGHSSLRRLFVCLERVVGELWDAQDRAFRCEDMPLAKRHLDAIDKWLRRIGLIITDPNFLKWCDTQLVANLKGALEQARQSVEALQKARSDNRFPLLLDLQTVQPLADARFVVEQALLARGKERFIAAPPSGSRESNSEHATTQDTEGIVRASLNAVLDGGFAGLLQSTIAGTSSADRASAAMDKMLDSDERYFARTADGWARELGVSKKTIVGNKAEDIPPCRAWLRVLSYRAANKAARVSKETGK